MDCALFHERLDALLDGTLSAVDQVDAESHRTACARCDELHRLMRGDDGEGPVGQAERVAPIGLTDAILARTSGPPCAHAHARLAEWVDQALDGPDQAVEEADLEIGLALVDAHRLHCPECAALSRALIRLHDDLPAFAELAPDAALVSEVLVRTIPRRVRGDSASERLRAAVGGLLARPRIAWEAGYAVTLVVWLFFGASWSPLRATPAQALTLIQQGASDTQSAGVSAMAALNRRVSRFSERALGDELGPGTEGGLLSGLSVYSRRAAAAAPNLSEHWQRFTTAVLDRDLFGGVDALRSLSRDAGAMLRRLVSTTTDSGALPDQRSTS
jgi:predicted anti-sigma-YlaC factor YlaD